MAEASVGHSCLYVGSVMHRRLRPFVHRFTYRVFSLYLDLDELAGLSRRLALFSHNRWNLLGFRDRDHGPRDGSPLRPWAEAQLAAAGLAGPYGAIRLLCFPRLLGYVFNPLSVWFCHDGAGRLLAVIYEVSNTRGQHHAYTIAVGQGGPANAPLEQGCAKLFHVSPFIPMAARYHFRLREPSDRLAIAILESVAEGPILAATHTGRRRGLTDRNLAAALLGHPLMAVKVIGAIHWQALRLWLKGARVQSRPVPADATPTPPIGPITPATERPTWT